MTVELKIPLREERLKMLAILGGAGYPVHVEERVPVKGAPWHNYAVVVVENVTEIIATGEKQ